jgi:osmotically-inducible protein OsmY
MPIDSESRTSTFRPTPLRGQSQLRGRQIGVQRIENSSRIITIPGLTSPDPNVVIVRQRALAAQARLRTEQQSRSRLAAQALRQSITSSRYPRNQVSTVLTLSTDDVFEPTQEYSNRYSEDRTAWLSSAGQRLGIAGFDVQMSGGTAILQGEAPAERQRRLAERLLLLEPGVESVDNRITVAPNP